MTEAERRYLGELVRAWSHGRGGTVPMPATVAPETVWQALAAHEVEAALGPLLPAGCRPPDHDSRLAAARDRTADLLLECERIAPALAEAAGRFVLLKGAALAMDHYADPGERWFLDLDVLVARDRIDAVTAALRPLGYRLLAGMYDPGFYDRHHFHRILLGPQGACLEVHWAVTLPGSVYRHDADGIGKRARPSRLGRRTVHVAAPVDQILHATYQNVADGYQDLRRVLDLVLLLRALAPADWSLLARLAAADGLSRGLALTLHLVKQVAGVEPPAGFLETLGVGPGTWRTLRGLDLVGGCLERRADGLAGYTELLHLVTVARPGSRWREIGRFLWPGASVLLQQGHPRAARPGLRHRLGLGLHQAWLLARMGWLTARAYARG